MREQFIQFMTNPDQESFLAVRESVIHDAGYDPYSEDIKVLDNLFIREAYQEIADHKNVNILLSPLAHLIKSVAYEKLAQEEEAKSEMYMWQTLLKSMALTGDGSEGRPYVVTRISDEKDLVEYLQETFASQSLVTGNGKYLDCIRTESGKDIYFDITACYKRMSGRQQEAVALSAVPPATQEEAEEEIAMPEIPFAKEEPVSQQVVPEEEDFIDEETEEEEFVEKKKWWKFW